MTEEIAKGLFALSGFTVTKMWPLINRYWGTNNPDMIINSPWWLVKTEFGLIEVGWRKRVMSIDWSDTGVEVRKLTSDDVTLAETYVHAWNYPKALEYLTALREFLELDSRKNEDTSADSETD
jgi:hypothetical protein